MEFLTEAFALDEGGDDPRLLDAVGPHVHFCRDHHWRLDDDLRIRWLNWLSSRKCTTVPPETVEFDQALYRAGESLIHLRDAIHQCDCLCDRGSSTRMWHASLDAGWQGFADLWQAGSLVEICFADGHTWKGLLSQGSYVSRRGPPGVSGRWDWEQNALVWGTEDVCACRRSEWIYRYCGKSCRSREKVDRCIDELEGALRADKLMPNDFESVRQCLLERSPSLGPLGKALDEYLSVTPRELKLEDIWWTQRSISGCVSDKRPLSQLRRDLQERPEAMRQHRDLCLEGAWFNGKYFSIHNRRLWCLRKELPGEMTWPCLVFPGVHQEKLKKLTKVYLLI